MPRKPIKLSADEAARDPETQKLLINLKIVFKRYIQKRDRYRCVLSGAIRNVSISHYFGASLSKNELMRYDERNVHVMANTLHREYHECNPLPFTRFMLGKFGMEGLEAMEKESGKKHTLNKQEIIDLTNHYVRKTQDLGEVVRQKEFKNGRKK